jgi:hypothetical protein
MDALLARSLLAFVVGVALTLLGLLLDPPLALLAHINSED